MTQPTSDQEAYDADVRRRIEMANYPAAPPSSSSLGGYASPSIAAPPQASAVQSSPHGSSQAVKVVVLVTLAALVVIGAIAFLFVLGMRAGTPSAQPVAATSQAVAQPTVAPTSSPTADATSDATADATEEATSGPPFASSMDPAEMYDAYMEMKRRGKIYEIIPDTDEGRAYFTAFMYSIVDLKAAAIWGPLDAESLADLATREQHFLALEDLDLTVDITFEDGTSFTHDGKPPAAG